MSSDFYTKTAALAARMAELPVEAVSGPAFVRGGIFRDWLGDAYSADSFLYEGDYIEAYMNCRNKEPETLSADEVRAAITFCLRQMRSEYPPYTCLRERTLERCLSRWLELKKKEVSV